MIIICKCLNVFLMFFFSRGNIKTSELIMGKFLEIFFSHKHILIVIKVIVFSVFFYIEFLFPNLSKLSYLTTMRYLFLFLLLLLLSRLFLYFPLFSLIFSLFLVFLYFRRFYLFFRISRFYFFFYILFDCLICCLL